MSSGTYDGLHSSSSYGQGDSWRPSGSGVSVYDRPNYPPRRHSPSASRRYVSHDAHFLYENNYRPNVYRPEENATYYSRSPSPEHHSRTYTRPQEPDTWGRPASSVPWEDPSVGPVSPTSSTVKPRRDSMLATRMFEPNDSWKQNHVDRPLRTGPPRIATTWSVPIAKPANNHTLPLTPNPYTLADTFTTPNPYLSAPLGDRYRPPPNFRDSYSFISRADTYRPGWSPSSPQGRDSRRRTTNVTTEGSTDRTARRSTSHYDASNRRVSGTASLISSGSPPGSSPYRQGLTQGVRSHSRSHRSSSYSRRSHTRSPSRGRRSLSRDIKSRNTRQSISRGRRSLSREISSVSGNLPLGSKKLVHSVKSSWDRPTSAPSIVPAPTTSTQTPDPPPLRKDSWNRASSRSSIASTHVSDRSPSPVPQPQPAEPVALDAKNIDLQQENVPDDSKSTGPSPVHPAALTNSNETIEVDNEVTHAQGLPPSSPGPSPPYPHELSVASVEDRVLNLSPSPPSHSMSPIPQRSPPHDAPDTVIPSDSMAPDKINGGLKTSLQDNVNSREVDPHDQHSAETSPRTAHSSAHLDSIMRSTKPQATQIVQSPPISPDGVTMNTQQNALDNQQQESIEVVPSDTTDSPVPTQPPLSELPVHKAPIALPEGIPTEARSFKEALRIVVMTRLLCDRQTREERTNPVLLSNLAFAAQPTNRSSTSPDTVVKDVLEGSRHDKIMEEFTVMKMPLEDNLRKSFTLLSDKVQRLQGEYLMLHERWLLHCASLDEQSKPIAVETDAVQSSGRTTRRSAAGLGDAVRSDLEMEQIIASLGNDDATDPNHLSLRNLAIVPDMISVTCSKIGHYFDDTNHLVHNPGEYYGPHTGIHDWTDREKEIFLDKFAAHPKQFGTIAEHLPNKTAAQCVDYYYLHKKKFIDFRKVISQYAPNKRKRRGTGKKRGNGLLADIRQHDAEVHGEVGSRSAARPSRSRRTMAPPELKDPKRLAPSRRRGQLDLTPSGSATPTPEPESRRRARRSNVVSFSRTVSVSPEEAEEEAAEEIERPAKRAKRARRVKSVAIITDEPPTPELRLVDMTESVSRRKSGPAPSQWSDEDKKLFLTLLGQHGDDFKRIAASMPNKTTIQVSNYFKANFDELEKVAAAAPKRSPTPYSRKDRTSPLPTPAPESTDTAVVPEASSIAQKPRYETVESYPIWPSIIPSSHSLEAANSNNPSLHTASLDRTQELEKSATMAPTRSPAPYAPNGRRNGPSTFPAFAPEITSNTVMPESMSSLTPESHQMSTSTISNRPQRSRYEIELLPVWPSSRPSSNSISRAASPDRTHPGSSHTYPLSNSRPPVTYTSHPIHPNYAQPPPIHYNYPPYTGSHYSQFEPMMTSQPHRMHHHPYSLPEPLSNPGRRMVPIISSMRARENPYPIVPSSHYHNSLEHS